MIKKEDVFKIGKIGKPHGLHGELSFQFDDDIFDTTDAEYLVLEIDGILVPFFIEEYRFHGNGTVLMKFCDIDNVEQARELTGCNVFFSREHTDKNGDLSWAQIIGFTVENVSTGRHLGTLRSIDDSTLNILFEVETPDGQELLLPANEDLITAIDAEERLIKYNLPHGLVEE